MKKLITMCAVVGMILAISGVAKAGYVQGFETDIVGWDVFGGAYDAVRVDSGNNGIASLEGSYYPYLSSYHGEVGGGATNWGGESDVFPAGGFVTSVAVYLDVDGGASNDTRFDFTSALNGTDGNHRRDFAFNGGFYNDESLGNRFVFSASNTAGRGDAYPKNPGRDPFAISTSGWYYLQHDFYDAGAGVVAVDLSILNATGSTIKTWTLSDLTDIANDTAGGNRYGWFASNEFPFLAIDNSSLTVVPEPATMVLLGLGGLLIRRKRRA